MRRDKRTEVDEAARLHPNHWSSLEARVLDISPSGFKAECSARVPVGSSVAVDIPGLGKVHAHVTWRRLDRFGARFDAPVELTRCRWTALDGQLVLSRLLADRAEAHRGGKVGPELELRRKILRALPVKKVASA